MTRRRTEYSATIEKQLEPLLARSTQLLESEAAQIRKLEGRLAEVQGASRSVQPKASVSLSAAPARSTPGKPSSSGSAFDGIDLRDKSISAAQRRKIGILRNRRQRLAEEQRRLRGELEALG